MARATARRRPPAPCAVALLALAAGACSAAAPTPSPPLAPPADPPTITALGIAVDIGEAAPVHTYFLADGRRFDVSTDHTRVLFEGGPGRPFVMGFDANGPFVGVFLHQDGMPDDCFIAGVPASGIERGEFIEIHDVLWRKAATFTSPVPLPAAGERYPSSTRFCFDDRAEITGVVPADRGGAGRGSWTYASRADSTAALTSASVRNGPTITGVPSGEGRSVSATYHAPGVPSTVNRPSGLR